MNIDEVKYIGVRLISGLKFIEFDDVEMAKPCVRTSEGFRGCKLFLSNIEMVNEILEIEAYDRSYRENFTNNYKTLFPFPKKRVYRVDVLEASIEGYTSIWVNGEKFEFQAGVINSGKELHESWVCLVTLIFQLKDWIEERIQENKDSEIFGFEDEIWKANIKSVLNGFDKSWVSFEREYIGELISIEKVARRFVLNLWKHIEESGILLDVVCSSSGENERECGDKLSLMKRRFEQFDFKNLNDPVFFELVRNLFRVSNLNNKESFSENIDLSTWEQIMQIYNLARAFPHSCFSVIGALSEYCISELTELLGEVVELCKTPEKIDPHICNNLSLQQQILRVEESWGMTRRQLNRLVSMEKEGVEQLSLVQLVKLLQSIFWVQLRIRRKAEGKGGGTGQVEGIFQESNIFLEKLEECDVGAILALPKICCILYLVSPRTCSEVITQFLNCEVKIEINSDSSLDTEEGIDERLLGGRLLKRVELRKPDNFEDGQLAGSSKESSFFSMVEMWNLFLSNFETGGRFDAEVTSLNQESEESIVNGEELLLTYMFIQLTGVCLCGEGQLGSCEKCKKELKTVQDSELVGSLRDLLGSLVLSIEEVSILMQRVSVSEWNEFMKAAMICITRSPVAINGGSSQSSKCNLDAEVREECVSNQKVSSKDSEKIEAKDVSSSPGRSKIQKFLNNVGSLIFGNTRNYGEFTISESADSANGGIPRGASSFLQTFPSSNFGNTSMF
ncbi:phospho-2-dehydro-3-deoxyheptonate aldolase,related protein [Cryptosporidium felis]|nr:phospho-2-dehydro-3-deoxyheptonate aldolase,related protein [Cryptosporidium felis]